MFGNQLVAEGGEEALAAGGEEPKEGVEDPAEGREDPVKGGAEPSESEDRPNEGGEDAAGDKPATSTYQWPAATATTGTGGDRSRRFTTSINRE
jgi:hypothetical protein